MHGLGAASAGHRCGQTVEVQFVDLESAREDAGPAIVVVQDDDPWRLAHRGVHGGDVAVFQILVGQHRGGLRSSPAWQYSLR